MAVFGTLRSIPSDQGNSSLMYIKKPISHKKCFVPHFTPNGIWLEFKENACGLAEIFFYEPTDWFSIIDKIDLLEGIKSNISQYGYRRTLMNIRLLPDDFADDLYLEGIRLKDRDLKIPKEEWKFPAIPAWVYSNDVANGLCKSVLDPKESPIIFECPTILTYAKE